MKPGLIESPCGCGLTPEQVRTLWGRYTGSLSSGRPRETDRCACGLMTKARAMARGHRCVAVKKASNYRTERNMTDHKQHRVVRSRDIGWTHCVTPEACAAKPARQSAHGCIVRVDTCACGAERRTEINGAVVNRGAWEKA